MTSSSFFNIKTAKKFTISFSSLIPHPHCPPPSHPPQNKIHPLTDSMLQSTDTYGFEYVASAAARSAMQSAHLWMNYESGRILGYQNSCHGNYLQAKHLGGFFTPDAHQLLQLFLSSRGDEPRRGCSSLWLMALVSGRAVIVGIALRAVITVRSALGCRIGITFIMLLLQCFLDNTTTTMYLRKRRLEAAGNA